MKIRILLLFLLVFASGEVLADTYYYIYAYEPDPNTAARYDTLDRACQASDADFSAFYVPFGYMPGPYEDPTDSSHSMPPRYIYFYCPYSATSTSNGETIHTGRDIQQLLDTCDEGKVLNPQTNKCESPNEDQDRKEDGDPEGASIGAGFFVCQTGDPINVATGNVYESEIDYQDADGELQYARHYNSNQGMWRFSYQTSLYINPKALIITFEDGRATLFSLSNGVPIAEATELGSMTQVDGTWTYRSPTNEQFSFDAKGKLTRWQQSNGLAQTLSYAQGASVGQTVITVTDSQGHSLQVSTANGVGNGLVAGGLAVTYGQDSSGRLASVQRAWSEHTTSRSYLYEDAAHPKMLTGVVDERGIRSATWKYDAQGRAIANYGAGGANQKSLSYNSDGTITVTNALGSNTTYTYQVIQGVNRVKSVAGEPVAGCPASNSSYTYYPNGQVQTKTDAIGSVTTYTYDARGREITRTEAKGTAQERTTSTTWQDSTFLPLSVTTSDRVTTYTYDDQGRLLSSSVHAIKE